MRTLVTAALTASMLGGFGCSAPDTGSQFTPKKKTEAAGRLQFVRGSFAPSLRAALESPTGVLEAKLRVGPDGSVQQASMVGGSSQLWSIYHQSIQGLKFTAGRKDDHGPWDVSMVFSATSSGTGGALESTQTGRSEVKHSMSMQIVDVTDAAG